MIARRAALVLSVVVIACLNVIILLGASFPGRADLQRAFDAAILVFDLALVASSLLLGNLFARRRERILASLFFANVGVYVFALIYRTTGRMFPASVLFGADLYWLQLYLVVLMLRGRWLLGARSET